MKIKQMLFFSVALFLTAHAGVQDGSNIALEEIAQRSELIVAVRVIDQYSAWDELRREIYTYTTLEIEKSIKNPAARRQIQMCHLGGRVGDIESQVHGMPRFILDQRVIVFLGPYPDSETYGLIDWVKGVYRIENGSSGTEMVSGAGIESQPLESFVKTIADYLE
ncbi:hypothetical protein JW992_16000 [candidate division KSB1 bacterium]|nr:hypothetical protein [candidate division KSB1 bacterium]